MIPAAQMQRAFANKDYVSPYRSLDSRGIRNINTRVSSLKKDLFLKDKLIQDKIQQVGALTFYHQKQLDIYNSKLQEKNERISRLKDKLQRVLDELRLVQDKIDYINQVHAEAKLKKALLDKEAESRRLREKIGGDAAPSVITNEIYTNLMKENYELKLANRELDNRVKALK